MAKVPPKKRLLDEYGLSPQERIFCDNYAITGNKTTSAAAAGIKRANATVYAGRWLRNVAVQTYLENLRKNIGQKLVQEHNLTVDEILRELAAIVRFDPAKMYDESGEMLAPNKMDETTRRQVESFEVRELYDDGKLVGYAKKAKRFSKMAALELAGRHLAMWGEKDGGAISILNINIITDKNQLDNPGEMKVIEHVK